MNPEFLADEWLPETVNHRGKNPDTQSKTDDTHLCLAFYKSRSVKQDSPVRQYENVSEAC